jgi:hypothetical protein
LDRLLMLWRLSTPDRNLCCGQERKRAMGQVTTVRLDIAKPVFRVHGVDQLGVGFILSNVE